MHESQWFYVRDEKRTGPVGLSAMREMLARGDIGPQTMVWTVGMNQWTAAADVPTLSGQVHGTSSADVHPTDPVPVAALAPAPAPAPAPSSARPAVSGIGYHYVAAGMPQRAVDTLSRYGRPSGDTGDWPLDDARVAQFAEAVQARKKVTGAAQLYRALLFLSVIGLVIVAVVFAFMLADPPRGSGGATAVAVGMGTALAVLIGFSALYYVTWRATMRAHRWAPMTMMIVFLLGVLLNLVSLLGALAGRADPAVLVGGLVGTALAGLFAFISMQSLLAIPNYLAQPAWCQELIVKAGM